MVKAAYIGNINAKKVKKIYLGETNVAKRIKRAYIGDETGKARLFYTSGYVWKKYNLITTTTYYYNRYTIKTSITYQWGKYNITNKYYLSFGADSNGATMRNSDIGSYVYRRVTVTNSGQLQYSSPVKITETNYTTLCGDGPTGDLTELTKASGYFFNDQLLNELNVDYGYDPDASSSSLLAKFTSWSVGTSRKQAQGSFIDYVTGDAGSYPSNGIYNNYWYVSNGTVELKEQGTFVDSISTTSNNQYPSNGVSGSYWYVYDRQSTSYSQGSYIDTIESDNPSAYPTNGRHSDGYWYVKQSE